jgi:hypothetical protein
MSAKAYVLNTTIQMIDINNNFKSFRTVYNITCKNLQDDFEYAIVSQTKLDEQQFHFKKAVGYHEDSFVSENGGTYQDWYLVLKAPKDTPCTIALNVTSLDPAPQPVQPASPQPPRQPAPQPQPRQQPQRRSRARPRSPPPPPPYEDDDSDLDDTPPKTTGYHWSVYLLLALVIAAAILGVLWWMGYLQKMSFTPPQLFPASAPVEPVAAFEQPVHDPAFINEMRELKINL